MGAACGASVVVLGLTILMPNLPPTPSVGPALGVSVGVEGWGRPVGRMILKPNLVGGGGVVAFLSCV